jgi:hypothetical protein
LPKGDITTLLLQEREVVLQWHVPCDKIVTVAEDNPMVIIVGRDGRSLRLSFESACRPLWVGQRLGKIRGRIFSFVSFKNNCIEPSRLIRACFRLTGHLQVTSRFFSAK